MKPAYILTPYFIDQPVPGLLPLAGQGFHINDPRLSATLDESDSKPGISVPGGAVQHRLVTLYRPLADFVHKASTRGEMPVSLAGDCCTSIAVLAGLQRAGISPTLIWLDAHGDFNTWETTPSGFLGGMPLAMLAGRGEQTILEGLDMSPLPEMQIILSDARDLDPGERKAIARSDLTYMYNFDELLEILLPPGPLYIHFDTDVIDPTEVPAMNYPAPGGPTAESVRQVFRRLAQTGQIVAASLSSWNPDFDDDGQSQEICMSAFQELITL
jgi:arginase